VKLGEKTDAWMSLSDERGARESGPNSGERKRGGQGSTSDERVVAAPWGKERAVVLVPAHKPTDAIRGKLRRGGEKTAEQPHAVTYPKLEGQEGTFH